MYPLLKLLITTFKSSRAEPIAINDSCETTIRCMPWDVDVFLELNNGRVLTLYDLGRFDLSIRTGLSKVLKDNKWGLVVASSTIRYRRRVRMFDKIIMRTQLAGVDDRWFYIQQSMTVKGKPVSSVLLRTAITRKGGIIPSDEVYQAMNTSEPPLQAEAWVKQWIDCEDSRPWPPAP